MVSKAKLQFEKQDTFMKQEVFTKALIVWNLIDWVNTC